MPPKKTNPFKLRDFMGVDPDTIKILADRGIRTSDQLLNAAAWREPRAELIRETGIQPQTLLELVRLSATGAPVGDVDALLTPLLGTQPLAFDMMWQPVIEGGGTRLP